MSHHVRDGDTIEVGGLPIRLEGLAAPERDELGGTQATRAMRQMVNGRELRCELNGERTGDRCVGVCYLEDRDISAELVSMGLARGCLRFSGEQYRRAETRGGRGRRHDPGELPAARILPGAVS